MMKKKLFSLLLVLTLALACAAAAESGTGDTADPAAFQTPGNYVTFGTYPQTSSGDDQTPVEWLVLDYDEENHRALLLSRYGLDAKPYHKWRDPITWEKCDLRAWLNDEFLNTAFTEAEQAAILLTDVDNCRTQCYGWSPSGGNDTQDKLFLLSYGEAHKYFNVQFGVKNNVAARVKPTDYAISRGSYHYTHNLTAEGEITAWWALRSPGSFQYCSALVGSDGSLYHTYVDSGTAVIRPAFWLDTDALN